MFYTTDRIELRNTYFNAWRKYQHKETLEPLEKQIIKLIDEHPEYLEIISNPEKYRDYDFNSFTDNTSEEESAEMNPFLHLGLHLAILEQVATNRPQGMAAVYRDLVNMFEDAHHAEHHIMEILANIIWENQQQKKVLGDKTYIKQLKKLLKKGCSHHH